MNGLLKGALKRNANKLGVDKILPRARIVITREGKGIKHESTQE